MSDAGDLKKELFAYFMGALIFTDEMILILLVFFALFGSRGWP